jgi:hypothetical protein
VQFGNEAEGRLGVKNNQPQIQPLIKTNDVRMTVDFWREVK